MYCHPNHDFPPKKATKSTYCFDLKVLTLCLSVFYQSVPHNVEAIHGKTSTQDFVEQKELSDGVCDVTEFRKYEK